MTVATLRTGTVGWGNKGKEVKNRNLHNLLFSYCSNGFCGGMQENPQKNLWAWMGNNIRDSSTHIWCQVWKSNLGHINWWDVGSLSPLCHAHLMFNNKYYKTTELQCVIYWTITLTEPMQLLCHPQEQYYGTNANKSFQVENQIHYLHVKRFAQGLNNSWLTCFSFQFCFMDTKAIILFAQGLILTIGSHFSQEQL